MLELKPFKKEDLKVHYAFLQMPRAMIDEEMNQFDLSIWSRFTYILLFDRVSLSAKNNWVNEDGEIYIYFTLDEIMRKVKCSKSTARKALDELNDKNFLVKERQGVGKPTKIYLKNICPLCNITYNIASDEPTVKDTINGIDVNETTSKNYNNEKTVHTNINFQQVQPQQYQQQAPQQNQQSQIVGIDIKVLETVIATVTREVMKSMGFNGNTEQVNHNVDVAQNQSVAVVESKSYKEEIQHKTQHKTVAEPKKSINIEQAKSEVRQKIAEEKGLPKSYMNDKTMMNLAIKDMIDFDGTVEINNLICKGEPTERDKKYMSTLSLYCDALTEMLTTDGHMKLDGTVVTANDVYDELQKYIVFSDFYKRYMIEDLSGDVQGNFNKALDNTIIKNKMKYIQTCIWNSLLILADEMAVTMANIDKDIERMNMFLDRKRKEKLENKVVAVKKTEEVKVPNIEIQSVDGQRKQAKINEFYEEFTTRWSKLTKIDGLTDANKSQLDILYNKFSTDIILETLDKVLEDTTLLKNIAIYHFVFDFDNIKVA